MKKYTHIAQNVAETGQKYFQSFIAIEILPQHFCQLFMLNFERNAHCRILMFNELIVNVQIFKLMVIVEHSCSFNVSSIHS